MPKRRSRKRCRGRGGFRGRAAPPALALLALAVLALGACLEELPPPTDPELAAELGLPPETPIHTVLLSGRGDRTRVLPAHIRIEAGHLVQFRVMDGRVHRLRFDASELGEAERAFLLRTGQAEFPPLVERDARLVLTFADAPDGLYPFVVEGSGPPVEGTIRVGEPG